MSCKMCQLPIICVIGLDTIKAKYIKLFKIIFPKKPIELVYCVNCYNLMINELEMEMESKKEHFKVEKKVVENLVEEKPVKINRYTVLDINSVEYIKIKEHFTATLPYKILRIEKNNNSRLEAKFIERSKHLTCQNVKYLFHGADDKAYENILETGFDLKFALKSGALGAGIYFAEDASYSHNFGRQTKTNIGQINHILYCKVNLGHTCEGQMGLTGTPKGFDGVHSSFRTYALFDNFQGIPEYIIYYLI